MKKKKNYLQRGPWQPLQHEFEWPPKNNLRAATDFVGDFGAVFAIWWTFLLLHIELKLNLDDIFTV